MKATKEPVTPVTVPTRILKGKDGREPFADKIARADETLKRVGLPEDPRKRR
ncbi:hypothetical protein GCM10027190_02410 [Spirosoma areae]